ncbi:MAG: ATP-binding cassette domain-containing protein [Bacilli bacterium]
MIKLENVNKFFYKHKKNQIHVINNTSLTLEDKGMVALLGPSGCGKTTLLNTIGGLDKIDSGKIYINGERISKRSVSKVDKIRNINIGYIFQDYYLVNNMTVYDNVALVLKINGIKDKDEISKRVNYVLEKVGMYRYRNRYANMLSGGERQRVGIARAIVKDPSIIIADEPTGNLDSKNTIEIMNIIKAISKDRLVILVTHETELADFYADRILKIEDGKIIEDISNNHDNDLDYRLDNKIYLKDLENHEIIDKENLKVNFYSDTKERLNINLILKNGNIYIQSTGKVEVIDSNSSIELVDDHYKKISKDIYQKYKFDFDKIINKDIKKRYTSIFNPITLIKNGFKKVINYSTIKKLLLIGFFLSGIFITYSISSLYGIYNIEDSKFVTMNKNYLVIDSKKIDVNDFLKYEKNDNVNYILPGNSLVSFYITYDDYYQTLNYKDIISGSLSSINLIDDKDIISGRMPNKSNEIVIDKLVFDSYHNSEFSSMLGINTPEKLFGRKLSMGVLEDYKIVGVVDLDSPSIYSYESEFINILYNTNNVGETTYYFEDYIIDDKSVENLIYDYNIYKDKITIKEGKLPLNDYEVIINNLYKESYKINQEIDVKINDKKLKVVGFYTSDDNISYMLANKNTIKYDLISNSSDMTLNVKDKNKALNDFKTMGLNIKDSYTYSKDRYYNSRMSSMSSTLIFSIIVLLISLIEIYLMMRSSFLSRIKEVGIYRAIGMKRLDIYKMFIGEIIAITTLGSITGVFFSSYIIYQLTTISYYANKFLMNFNTVITVIIIIYLFNLLVGLLPCALTIRKAPAQIMSRSDI